MMSRQLFAKQVLMTAYGALSRSNAGDWLFPILSAG